MPPEGPAARDALPAFTSTDASVLAGLPFLALVSRLVPAGNWPAVARTLSPLAVGDLAPSPKAAAAAIRQTLGAHRPELTGHDVLKGMAAEGILTFLQVLRSYPGGRWTPRVRALNFERVDAGLARGRGVVLWVAHGFHGHLSAKIAFRKAGLQVTHLSHPSHGFSASRFGIRYLNRLQTRVEDPFIAERVLLPVGGQNTALNVLARRLRANGVVSITGQRGTGRTVAAPFLAGEIRLAPGAPAMAQMTGAALLPVFAFRGEDNVIDVAVEPAIEIQADRPRDEAVGMAVRSYARMLEDYVLRYPKQWLGWVQL